jgi:hypothetical protein
MFFPNCGFFGASACGKVFRFYDISGVFGYNCFSFIKTILPTPFCVCSEKTNKKREEGDDNGHQTGQRTFFFLFFQ